MAQVIQWLAWLRESFWSEWVWLPPNTHWTEFPDFNELYYSLITAVVLLVIRFTLERYLYSPIGVYFGLRPFRTKRAADNPILERAFKGRNALDHKQVEGLAKQLDWTERQVERWIRYRKTQDRPTTLKKFTESAWRCNFYTCSFLYGLYTLSDKPWLWDSMQCFYDYPYHTISSTEWWYYNVELGFYLSLIVSQFFDIQRKDFWQMFIHHIVTVLLMCFSWSCNLVRIGTLVLVIHDFADIPLEGAKLTRYLKLQTISNVVFGVFTFCWVFSRLGLLPYRVITYSSYHALKIVPIFPAYYIFNSLLCALQLLHCVWTWLILKIAVAAFKEKEIKDLRESDDSSNDDSVKSSESEANHSPVRSSKSSSPLLNSPSPSPASSSAKPQGNGDLTASSSADTSAASTSSTTTIRNKLNGNNNEVKKNS